MTLNVTPMFDLEPAGQRIIRAEVAEAAEPFVAVGETVQIVPDGSAVANYAFDVTPARLVSGLITERGVLAPEPAALAKAFPERVQK